MLIISLNHNQSKHILRQSIENYLKFAGQIADPKLI